MLNWKDIAKFVQKLTLGFKSYMRNLNNFRQVVENSKSLNLMGYFQKIHLSKNTFLQLKHYIQRIYLTLLSTSCVKIHQIPYVIFETKGHFLRQNSSVLFVAQTLYNIYRSSSSKWKLSDFPLLGLKFTKFLISFFKQKVSFSSKLDLFSVSWEIILLCFFSWNFIRYWQK